MSVHFKDETELTQILSNIYTIENVDPKSELLNFIFKKNPDPGVDGEEEDDTGLKDFDEVKFKQYLTKYRSCQKSTSKFTFGNHLSYFDVIDSTQTFLEKNYTLVQQLPCGFTCCAAHQLRGKGRSNTLWKSAQGCLQFSYIWRHVYPRHQHHRESSISLWQFYAALAVIHAIRSEPGYEHLPIRLKWPNDLYYCSSNGGYLKLGGVLVQSNQLPPSEYAKQSGSSDNNSNEYLFIIGVGINLNNTEPTTCINSVISKENAQTGSRLPFWSREQLLGKYMSTFECLVREFEGVNGFKKFESMYYSYWIHSDQHIEMDDQKSGQRLSLKVKGINSYGYIRVEEENLPMSWTRSIWHTLFKLFSPVVDKRREFLLQPSSTSFDINKCMLLPKSS